MDVSPTLISNVTDAVIEDVREWQNRALDQIYPVVFFDAIMVKSRGVNDILIACIDDLRVFPNL